MRRTFVLLSATVLCLGGGALSARAGEIRGHIVIVHQLTKQRVSIPDYSLRGAAPQAAESPAAEQTPIASEYSKLAVFLEGGSLPPPAPSAATLAQHNRQFEPEVIIVPVGSAVAFPNLDPIFHNVFSLSSAKQLDLGYYPAGESRTVQFDRPGIVQVYCHLHPDMSAAIVVAPSSFLAQPDANGRFSFSDVPAGTYELVAWHKSAGFFRQAVVVPDDGISEVTMTIPVRKAAAP